MQTQFQTISVKNGSGNMDLKIAMISRLQYVNP